jgi:hypothetical protein
MGNVPIKAERLTKSREKDIKFGDDVSPAEQSAWLKMLKRCEMALGFGPEHLRKIKRRRGETSDHTHSTHEPWALKPIKFSL